MQLVSACIRHELKFAYYVVAPKGSDIGVAFGANEHSTRNEIVNSRDVTNVLQQLP